MKNNAGFTLMELIITMVIAAIVVTIGVPSFREIINDNRLTSNANAFVGTLNLARSETIKRGVRVTVCKSADGASCTTSGGYEQGWIVFADPNNPGPTNPTVDAGEPIIRAYGALSGGLTLIGNATVANYVSFVPAGVSQLIGGGFQADTLTLCKSGYTTSARQLVLSRGGRVRVQKMEPASAAGC
ncbi:MAG: GspH/FimT family pseudopilin [Candidatus Contendobacter sp.]